MPRFPISRFFTSFLWQFEAAAAEAEHATQTNRSGSQSFFLFKFQQYQHREPLHATHCWRGRLYRKHVNHTYVLQSNIHMYVYIKLINTKSKYNRNYEKLVVCGGDFDRRLRMWQMGQPIRRWWKRDALAAVGCGRCVALWSGMQHVACGMWHVACGVWSADCLK